MRFRAKNTRDSAQGYIQCIKCIGKPSGADGRTYGCTDGRSRDYYVTTKMFGFLGYQISLAMELR